MDDVKRKVLLDLFASPMTLLPVVVGATALLGSWAINGGQPMLTFAGIAGILTGVGVFASRMIFGLDQLTNQAYEYVLEKQQAGQLESLEKLKQKLQKDNDPRTESLLTQLRALYDSIKSDVKEGKISLAAHDVLDGVDNMFHVCVDYLGRSFDLWQTSQKMKGVAREQVLAQREELIEEVAQSCQYLEETINQLNAATTKRNKSDLARMREELDETIRVARRAEERTNEIGNEEKPYDPSEFE
ncbi:MAG: hypothetical protein AAF497_04185 [Planctomycetota bacterium]